MTTKTVTIELPEAVLQQLARIADATDQQLEALIAQSILNNLPVSRELGLIAKSTDQSLRVDRPVSSFPVNGSGTYQEVLDFLVSRPTSEQIIDFKVSEFSQSRLQSLLQKSRENKIDAAESAELDLYEQLDSLMGLLKIRAYNTNASQ